MLNKFQPGQAKTAIVVKALTEGVDADGYPTEEWSDLFHGEPMRCRWVNAHGSEVYEAARLSLKEAATLTMRYTPLINARCHIWRGGEQQDDAHAYEIISVDDIQDRHEVLALKVKRLVVA